MNNHLLDSASDEELDECDSLSAPSTVEPTPSLPDSDISSLEEALGKYMTLCNSK